MWGTGTSRWGVCRIPGEGEGRGGEGCVGGKGEMGGERRLGLG